MTVQTTSAKQFPLNMLVISPENVRVVNPEKAADKELIAGIKSLGLLQNLVVDVTDKGMGEVIAGGRRLAALQHLAKCGDISDNYLVDCRVKPEGADITEISLAENTQRTAMHPADEFVAFAKLKTQGFSVDEIAQKFGITKKAVGQRLALGGVAPKLVAEYRKGKIDLNALMAFTVSLDQQKQLSCYKELSNSGDLHSNRIKRWLIGESYTTSNGLGKFVGKTKYLKAGGVISEDLFQETVYLSDPELVVNLATEKLMNHSTKIEAEGWGWVDARVHGADTDDLVRLQPELVGVPKKMREKLEAMEIEFEAVNVACQEQDWPEALEKRYDELEGLISDFEEKLDEKYLKFTKAQMAYSGVLVTVNYQGDLSVDRGLAYKKDIPQPKAAHAGDTRYTEPESSAPKGVSQALKDDLRAYRQQITQAELLKDPMAAVDVLYYQMANDILGGRFSFGSLMDASFKVVFSETSKKDTNEGRAFDEIEAAAAKLNTEWLAIEDKAARFKAFRDLKAEDKSHIVTYCVARSLRVEHKGSNEAGEGLIDQLGVDYAEYWRPTANNYFKRINISQLKTVFKDVSNDEYEECHKDQSKGAVVINVEELVSQHENGKKWLPEQF